MRWVVMPYPHELAFIEKELITLKSVILFLVIIAAWFILQAYILPKMGIST